MQCSLNPGEVDDELSNHWNPSSNGNLKTTPNVWQLGYKSIFGLGNDEHNDDYKVVYAYYADNGDENVVLVYSFKHGTWKRIEREFSSGFVNPIVAVFLKLYRPNAKRGKNFNISYALGYMAVNNTNLKLMVHVDGWYTRLTGRTALKTVVVDCLVASPLHQSSFTNRSRLVKQAKGVHITS
nr:F-box/kelch-repeat protein At3g23880-like [Ipomoea batatas]